MVSREHQRAAASADLARLVRSRDFRAELASLRPGVRRTTVIAALPDDRMEYVWDRLREGGDAVGVVALCGKPDDHRVAVLWPASPERIRVAEEDDRLDLIHDDCSVEMFMHVLETVGPVVARRVAARILDGDELQPS